MQVPVITEKLSIQMEPNKYIWIVAFCDNVNNIE